MTPIRLGINGPSGTNLSSWASAAQLPYLLSPLGKTQYQIVAVCNSSIDSARLAIELFQLPPDTRPYDNPHDLAQDVNVDFVVCSTRVDNHYESIKPSIIAGKAAFAEWPLASNVSQVRELPDLAKDKRIKSLIGLHGPVTAPVNAVKGILEQGRIGRVLSSEVKASVGTGDYNVLPEPLRYFTQHEVGGNAITVGFGHLWDLLQFALGDAQDICSRLQLLQEPEVGLSPQLQDGASLFVSFRRGPPFPGEPHLTWTIHGEKGEIKFKAEGGTTPRTIASRPVNITLHDFSTKQVQDIS